MAPEAAAKVIMARITVGYHGSESAWCLFEIIQVATSAMAPASLGILAITTAAMVRTMVSHCYGPLMYLLKLPQVVATAPATVGTMSTLAGLAEILAATQLIPNFLSVIIVFLFCN